MSTGNESVDPEAVVRILALLELSLEAFDPVEVALDLEEWRRRDQALRQLLTGKQVSLEFIEMETQW